MGAVSGCAPSHLPSTESMLAGSGIYGRNRVTVSCVGRTRPGEASVEPQVCLPRRAVLGGVLYRDPL